MCKKQATDGLEVGKRLQLMSVDFLEAAPQSCGGGGTTQLKIISS